MDAIHMQSSEDFIVGSKVIGLILVHNGVTRIGGVRRECLLRIGLLAWLLGLLASTVGHKLSFTDWLATIVRDELTVIILWVPLLVLLPSAILSPGKPFLPLLLLPRHLTQPAAQLILIRSLVLELGDVEEGIECPPLGVADGY